MVNTNEYRQRAEKQKTTKSEMQLMIFELCNEVDSLRRVADTLDDKRRYAHLTAVEYGHLTDLCKWRTDRLFRYLNGCAVMGVTPDPKVIRRAMEHDVPAP
jgi:hypothetical protein